MDPICQHTKIVFFLFLLKGLFVSSLFKVFVNTEGE